jgi:hypothetical protein
MNLDPNADYVSMTSLATALVDRITGYQEELKGYDENDLDGFHDYLSGLISAYQSVAGMIGVPLELYYSEED